MARNEYVHTLVHYLGYVHMYRILLLFVLRACRLVEVFHKFLLAHMQCVERSKIQIGL